MKGLIPVFLCGMVFAGQLYEIAEPDAFEEIGSAFREGKIGEVVEETRRRVEDYSGEELPPAEESYTYEVDPTYCLEENIYYREGESWRVLYPEGYCFNPIEYVPYDPPPMVIFNACRKEEREKVSEIVKGMDSYMLVSSGCPVRRVSEIYRGIPVYILTPELRRKLDLRHTISLVLVDRERGRIRVEVLGAGGSGGR